MMLAVTDSRYPVNSDSLTKVANAAFSLLVVKEGKIEVVFISPSKIRGLNKEYRGIDKVTDVLSFEIEKKPLIGQIFICYNRSREQANKLGKQLEDELALLLVHGILHLYGYDHEDDKEAKRMESKEIMILNKVGINR